jgi:DNA invertase Pin-like site-specific DNA recombinase
MVNRMKLRCAVYTRKSSEEGLEQDFNSLDAQREACAAYIKSQQHEGWVLERTRYDDGGWSGATLQRPALQRLLADIDKIDVVVVYKVDRLTRSLVDFAKIVDRFDHKGVSFVSVTQQFNTTTSMGRLTLNVLLSFAQFEREVTGERIRDKIAASKRKGMWMGGYPPLGFDPVDRKLVINDAEAETVRHIYRQYLKLGSVRALGNALNAQGIVSKVRKSRCVRMLGGRPLARGALYRILQNRIYLGEIVHQGSSYAGQHEAIIDADLWSQVQTLLTAHRVARKTGATSQHPSLLAGLLFDQQGKAMTASHGGKNGRRYRYYISRSLTTATRETTPTGRRIPAGEIEQLVLARVRALLADESAVLEVIGTRIEEAADQKRLLQRAVKLSQAWPALPAAKTRALLSALIARIDVLPERVDIHLIAHRLADVLVTDASGLSPASTHTEDRSPVTLSVPAQLKRAGLGVKMIVAGSNLHGQKTKPDPVLVKLIAKAYTLHDKLLQNGTECVADLARREGLAGSYVTRLIRLAFLSPDITRAILDGRQPRDLTAAKLRRLSRLPLDWNEQKAALGFS